MSQRDPGKITDKEIEISAAEKELGFAGNSRQFEREHGTVYCILVHQSLEYRRLVQYRYRLEAHPHEAVRPEVCDIELHRIIDCSRQCLRECLWYRAIHQRLILEKKQRRSAYINTRNANGVSKLVPVSRAVIPENKTKTLVKILGGRTSIRVITCMSLAARTAVIPRHEKIAAARIDLHCIGEKVRQRL
jgi:hypothetical protein